MTTTTRSRHEAPGDRGSPRLPGGRLHVLDVDEDGAVEGILCGVQFERDTEFSPQQEPLQVEGRFTAGPC